MSIGENGINQFLQAWAAQFALGLAALLNQYPAVSCSRARHFASLDLNEMLWWQSVLEGSRPFPMWVGARDATWSAVGKLNWIRLLESVQVAALSAVEPDLLHPIRCGRAAVVRDTPQADGLCYAVLGMKLARTELPSLLLALDPEARQALSSRTAVPVVTPMLQSLLDLEVPLSVALGQASLPVGEVLKITSGSVIHLRGHTGADVEILVHGTVVARGQVVASKGNYGVRIREIVSATERIKLCVDPKMM